MKKVIARFVMIICVVAILCSGCDNHKVDISKSDNIYCKSKVDYQITVPKTNLEQGDIYFCAPFYLLTNNEIHLIESEEGREYVIGEDATLEGENVDAGRPVDLHWHIYRTFHALSGNLPQEIFQ